MYLVKPSYEILRLDGRALELLELAGRTCYKSEDRIARGTAIPFIQRIVRDFGHESVIEHASITVKFIVDRGVTHELVRHRLCAYSQESTRYCNYGKKGVTFVIPPWVSLEPGGYRDLPVQHPENFKLAIAWYHAMLYAESAYLSMIRNGWTLQQARSVLPNSLKTEIVVTANFREWRHILKLRASKRAHPQMREIMEPLLQDLAGRIPVIFGDIIL